LDKKQAKNMSLKVFCEESCSTALQSIIDQGQNTCFNRTASPADADVILFEREDWRYVSTSKIFRAHPDRCVAITEWDHPSFFLPTICSSNTASWFTRGRSETMEYPLARRAGWNPYATIEPPPRDKKLLYSFVGKSSSRVRQRMFRHFSDEVPDDVHITNTASAVQGHTIYSNELQKQYVETLLTSKFALCPRGWGTGSVRLFEACELGIAPVILADGWTPIRGMDWSFAIFVAERRVRELDAIIRAVQSEWNDRGRAARDTFEKQFSPGISAQRLSEKILRLRNETTAATEHYRRLAFPMFQLGRFAKTRLRKALGSYRP
jgi:Exostosin family